MICFFLTTGADKIAVTDPHGWILTIIAVSVVFTGLLVLFCIYTISGNFFSGKYVRKIQYRRHIVETKEKFEEEDADMAAAALAFHLYKEETTHDTITLSVPAPVRGYSPWKDKGRMMRKTPGR